jgi:hypothetical protein
MNSKEDKLKGTHTEIHYNQTVKSEEKTLKGARQKQFITYKRFLIRHSADFSSEI